MLKKMFDCLIKIICNFKDYRSICNKKSVAYCRLSKEGSKLGYEPQKNLINKSQKNYKVCEYFCETLSGLTKLKDRNEINNMILYCKSHSIETVFISSLDRLGRDVNVIMNGISFLRKNGINKIYSIRENICIDENYIKSNYHELKSLAQKCNDDLNNICYRMNLGRQCAKENGVKMGRPNGSSMTDDEYLEKHKDIVELLNNGTSFRKSASITGKSLSTVKRVSDRIKVLRKNG